MTMVYSVADHTQLLALVLESTLITVRYGQAPGEDDPGGHSESVGQGSLQYEHYNSIMWFCNITSWIAHVTHK